MSTITEESTQVHELLVAMQVCLNEVSKRTNISQKDLIEAISEIFSEDFTYSREYLNYYSDVIDQVIFYQSNNTACKNLIDLMNINENSDKEFSNIFNLMQDDNSGHIELHSSLEYHYNALKVASTLDDVHDLVYLYHDYPFSHYPPLEIINSENESDSKSIFLLDYTPLNAKLAYDIQNKFECVELDYLPKNYILTVEEPSSSSEFISFISSIFSFKDETTCTPIPKLIEEFPTYYDPDFIAENLVIDFSDC